MLIYWDNYDEARLILVCVGNNMLTLKALLNVFLMVVMKVSYLKWIAKNLRNVESQNPNETKSLQTHYVDN
jgi:hypothetical protein